MASAAPSEQRGDLKRQPAIEPIAMRVPEACRYLGIGRSTLYVLIGEGEIEFIKLGSSTLVLTESLKSLVKRRRNPDMRTEGSPASTCIPISFTPLFWLPWSRFQTAQSTGSCRECRSVASEQKI